jgi:type IV pilus assembly protein PilF
LRGSRVRACLEQGRRDLAMEKLTRALEQAPRSADAHTAMAFAFNQFGETRLADRHYRRAVQLDRGNPNIRNTYGAFLCSHGRLREAERELLAAARNVNYPTPEVAWTNAGICAEREPDLGRAERYYRQALQANPRHADALWQMAQVSFDQGNALQARETSLNSRSRHLIQASALLDTLLDPPPAGGTTAAPVLERAQGLSDRP